MDRLVFILSLLTILSACKPTICETADKAAANDFDRGLYSFHSTEFLPVENTYLYVLRQNYNIKWYFTDSLDYYKCYDSTMVELLKAKYSNDFQVKAKRLADSLDATPNWYKPSASYNGEIKELINLLTSKLKSGGLKLDTDSRLFIQLTIDSTGAAKNPLILKGTTAETTDKNILDLIQATLQPTSWTPAYSYGQPIKSNFVFRLRMQTD